MRWNYGVSSKTCVERKKRLQLPLGSRNWLGVPATTALDLLQSTLVGFCNHKNSFAWRNGLVWFPTRLPKPSVNCSQTNHWRHLLQQLYLHVQAFFFSLSSLPIVFLKNWTAQPLAFQWTGWLIPAIRFRSWRDLWKKNNFPSSGCLTSKPNEKTASKMGLFDLLQSYW